MEPIRRHLAAATLCLILLAGAPALPQSKAEQNSLEVATSDTQPTFQTKVNLVTVPVVVRDKQGKAIGGLTREDFQLFDKGKPQVISKFSIEKPEAGVATETNESDPTAPSMAKPPAQPIASRFIAYVFDDLHLDFEHLSQARTAAEKHMATLESAARAGVFSTSGQVNLDFTDDRAKLAEVLNRLQPRSRAGTQQTECPLVSHYLADRIINYNDTQALQAPTLEAIAACGYGGPPPNVLGAQMAARTSAIRALNIGEAETRTTLEVLRNIVRRMSASPGQRIMIVISPGFLVIRNQPEVNDLIERAIRANLVINGLDARGLWVPAAFADSSKEMRGQQGQQMNDQYDQEAAIAQADVLSQFAGGTGGGFFHNSNDLFAGFQQVATRPEFVYMLGFSPQNLKNDGSFHALKVSLSTAKNMTLQARRGYYAPKQGTDAAEQVKQEIQDALFSRQEMHDIPVTLRTQFFKSSDDKATLSVLARLDVRHLHYRKLDGRNNDDVRVVSGLFDRNGNFLQAIEKRIELRLRDQTLENALGSGIATKITFDVTPGSYVVRLVVRDTEGQMLSAANGAVEIP